MTEKLEKPSIKTLTHSSEFVEKWKLVLQEVYGYETYMDYMIVPSLTGKKTLSYLPLLNYTDRLNSEVDDLLELGKDNPYQIRALNPEYHDFKENDTVDMRTDIKGLDPDLVFSGRLHRNCRRKVRQSINRNNFEVICARDVKLIDDFYPIFSKVMHKHGTPVNKKELFIKIVETLDCDVLIVKLEGKPISASLILYDEKVAELYWNVIDYDFAETQIGYFSFWSCMEHVANKGGFEVFDFGRSSYEGDTYRFKIQWGAEPVKIDIIKPNVENIYSKYELASKIWSRLPQKVTEIVGPRLCKYLADL